MRPELAAIELLQDLGIVALPIIPREICKILNIFYKEDFLNSFDGTLVYFPNSENGYAGYIGVNSNIKETGKKNFTCAHELGHLCLDIGNNQENNFACKKETIENFKNDLFSSELRANSFAAELLMPRFLFKKLVDENDPNWDNIKALAGLCETSLVATAKRFIDLTDHSCALIVSVDSKVVWYRKSSELLFDIKREDGYVPYDTHAFKVFKGINPPSDFDSIKATYWLNGSNFRNDSEILEWTLPKNSYGQVLTLLWDEFGLDALDDDNNEDEEEGAGPEWEPPRFYRGKRKS